MNFPSDQIQGSPTFHTRVEKLPDGRYKATNVSMAQVEPQIRGDEMDAIRAVRMATEAFIGKGGQ